MVQDWFESILILSCPLGRKVNKKPSVSLEDARPQTSLPYQFKLHFSFHATMTYVEYIPTKIRKFEKLLRIWIFKWNMTYISCLARKSKLHVLVNVLTQITYQHIFNLYPTTVLSYLVRRFRETRFLWS